MNKAVANPKRKTCFFSLKNTKKEAMMKTGMNSMEYWKEIPQKKRSVANIFCAISGITMNR